jgi:hypothetical protein
VEGAAEDEHALAAGDPASQLHGGLDRLGPGVHEEELLDRGRCDRHDLLGGGHQRVVAEGSAGVPEAVELVAGGRHHCRRVVAGVDDGDAGGEVQVALSLHVGYPASLAGDDLDV